VRRPKVEVVARSVEVRGQQEDRVEPVLLAVALRADEDRLLRDAVRRVRLLGIAVPELVLVERHRRELRVGAHRSGDDDLGCLVQASLLEQVGAHHQVRVPVPAWVRPVRADPADLGREMEHELRLGVVEQSGGRFHRREVVIGASRDDHRVAARGQPVDDM
jgi:hypothetical protein